MDISQTDFISKIHDDISSSLKPFICNELSKEQNEMIYNKAIEALGEQFIGTYEVKNNKLIIKGKKDEIRKS